MDKTLNKIYGIKFVKMGNDLPPDDYIYNYIYDNIKRPVELMITRQYEYENIKMPIELMTTWEY